MSVSICILRAYVRCYFDVFCYDINGGIKGALCQISSYTCFFAKNTDWIVVLL